VIFLSAHNRDDEFKNDGEPDHKIIGDARGLREPRKTWMTEWGKKFGKTISEENHDYAEALKVFNEKTTSGIDAILYEVLRSPVDSSIIKKTPVLNTVKARQRRKEESDSTKEDQLVGKQPKTNNKAGNIKLRIMLLIAVIGALVLVISLINALTNRGGIIVNPHAVISMTDTDTNTAVAVHIEQLYDKYIEVSTPIYY
jgi:hypothetical protein